MKGIILAGGSGTRLKPLTSIVCKQLLPVYDKPMIYYPLSTLMLAQIREVLIISTPRDLPLFERLFGNGHHLGMHIKYCPQKEPRGLAEALILGESFIDNDNFSLILGDNLYYGQGFAPKLQKALAQTKGATVFGYRVKHPERFGVVVLNETGIPIAIDEKPVQARSDIAVTGLYFYDNQAVSFAKSLAPSARGELEITDVNRLYLNQGSLHVEMLGRGFCWLDTGTHDSLLAASHFVQTVEQRQGFKIACIEELAFGNGWISASDLRSIAHDMRGTAYAQYLLELALSCVPS